jgi:hypothetical protein
MRWCMIIPWVRTHMICVCVSVFVLDLCIGVWWWKLYFSNCDCGLLVVLWWLCDCVMLWLVMFWFCYRWWVDCGVVVGSLCLWVGSDNLIMVTGDSAMWFCDSGIFVCGGYDYGSVTWRTKLGFEEFLFLGGWYIFFVPPDFLCSVIYTLELGLYFLLDKSLNWKKRYNFSLLLCLEGIFVMKMLFHFVIVWRCHFGVGYCAGDVISLGSWFKLFEDAIMNWYSDLPLFDFFLVN